MARIAALFASFLVPAAAFAQAPSAPPVDVDRWGVQVSYTPKFEINGGGGALDKLAEVMYEGGDLGLDISGEDFRIGVVRGRRLGGEWGVSYIHRSFDKESTQGGVETQCDTSDFNNVTFCSTFGDEYFYTPGVTLDGLEVNKLINFVTIKERVQIGMDIAGGVGWMKGTAIYRLTESEGGIVNNPPPGSTVNFPITVTETEIPSAELVGIEPVWIGRVEAAVGFIITPQVKVRVMGGLNIPGTQLFTIAGSVFF
jgi:hypothetical protein